MKRENVAKDNSKMTTKPQKNNQHLCNYHIVLHDINIVCIVFISINVGEGG